MQVCSVWLILCSCFHDAGGSSKAGSNETAHSSPREGNSLTRTPSAESSAFDNPLMANPLSSPWTDQGPTNVPDSSQGVSGGSGFTAAGGHDLSPRGAQESHGSDHHSPRGNLQAPGRSHQSPRSTAQPGWPESLVSLSLSLTLSLSLSHSST